MIAPSNPTSRAVNVESFEDLDDTDADVASIIGEADRPAEAERRQIMALVPERANLTMLGVGAASILLGGAVGFWLGRRTAPKPARQVRHAAATLQSAMDLAPVAVRLLSNPLIRAMALKIAMRQLSRRVAA